MTAPRYRRDPAAELLVDRLLLHALEQRVDRVDLEPGEETWQVRGLGDAFAAPLPRRAGHAAISRLRSLAGLPPDPLATQRAEFRYQPGEGGPSLVLALEIEVTPLGPRVTLAVRRR